MVVVPHDTELITTIAAAFGLALILGLVAVRLRLPPLVGYLVAGIFVGPFTPGLVADQSIASQLAEIGVILLMFGVGLHFSVRDLVAVRNISLPGAIVQIATATAAGALIAHTWGWTWGEGIVFGLALSVASTVVLLRALESRKLTTTPDGRIAVGWLIVEDLAMVLALVLLPTLAVVLGGTAPEGESGNVALSIGTTLLKVAAFGLLMYFIGRRVVPWLLKQVASTASRELFTLSLLAVAVGIAVGAAELFDVSFALAAFFAGMVISESDLSHRASSDVLPFQDAFAVLFFVSVGMLFDPSIILDEPDKVLVVFLIIVLLKSVAAFLIVLAFRYPTQTALRVAASLAQIGEFSFILIGLGSSLDLLPPEGESLVLAGAILSITANPLIFASIAPVERWFRRHPRVASMLERKSLVAVGLDDHERDALNDHVVLVGHGGVGGPVAESLKAEGITCVVIEQDQDVAESLRANGIQVINGDAARAGILEHAHLERARLLVITVGDSIDARLILEHARRANPEIDSVVRTHSESERSHMKELDTGRIVVAEREMALAVIRYTYDVFGIEGELSGPESKRPPASASQRSQRGVQNIVPEPGPFTEGKNEKDPPL